LSTAFVFALAVGSAFFGHDAPPLPRAAALTRSAPAVDVSRATLPGRAPTVSVPAPLHATLVLNRNGTQGWWTVFASDDAQTEADGSRR
jgi:hypothetical protein